MVVIVSMINNGTESAGRAGSARADSGQPAGNRAHPQQGPTGGVERSAFVGACEDFAVTAHHWWCRLRWSDMDAYGHVNNVQFLRYLEDARVAMLFEGAVSFEGQLVVVRHEIDYRRPLVYRPEPVLVRTEVAALNAGTVALSYEIVDDDSVDADIYVTARSDLAAYDLEHARPRRFTADERRRLEWLMG